jgi:hypothetical protein
MDFDEVLSQYDNIHDVEGIPGFRETLVSYGQSVGQVSEGANARISELETALAAAEEKATNLAARNYELLIAATAQEASKEPEPTEPSEEDKDVSTLFKNR